MTCRGAASKSHKKGDLNAFALYKQQAIDTLNLLSKQASLSINTEAAETANEVKYRVCGLSAVNGLGWALNSRRGRGLSRALLDNGPLVVNVNYPLPGISPDGHGVGPGFVANYSRNEGGVYLDQQIGTRFVIARVNGRLESVPVTEK
jgi:hypothetical protein